LDGYGVSVVEEYPKVKEGGARHLLRENGNTYLNKAKFGLSFNLFVYFC